MGGGGSYERGNPVNLHMCPEAGLSPEAGLHTVDYTGVSQTTQRPPLQGHLTHKKQPPLTRATIGPYTYQIGAPKIGRRALGTNGEEVGMRAHHKRERVALLSSEAGPSTEQPLGSFFSLTS